MQAECLASGYCATAVLVDYHLVGLVVKVSSIAAVINGPDSVVSELFMYAINVMSAECLACGYCTTGVLAAYRLIGLVVKVSASRAADLDSILTFVVDLFRG